MDPGYITWFKIDGALRLYPDKSDFTKSEAYATFLPLDVQSYKTLIADKLSSLNINET